MLFAFVGFIVAARGLYGLILLRISRSWPEVEVRVRERSPSSILEHGALNLDSDHFLEYEVRGKKYSKRIPDLASVSVAGIKVARRKPSGARRLRHHPRDPSWSVPADQGPGTDLLILGAGLALAAFALAAFGWGWGMDPL